MKLNNTGSSLNIILLGISLLLIVSVILFYKFENQKTTKLEVSENVTCKLTNLPDQQLGMDFCNRFVEDWKQELMPALNDKVITQIVAVDDFYSIRVTPKFYEPT